VRTQIITGSGEAIELDYLLGKRRGAWRIVDVFAKGTNSEVARYRADFASELQRKGAEGLIQALDRKTAQARGA
jgi:ABC-type transporter MlaC component